MGAVVVSGKRSIVLSEAQKGGFHEITWLAYPVVISMLAQSVLGIVDTFFMGYVSTEAQAGVGLGNILTWTLFAFFFGLVNGVTTFVSQKEGEGTALSQKSLPSESEGIAEKADAEEVVEAGKEARLYREAGEYARYGLAIAVFSGVLLWFFQPLLSGLMWLLETPAEIAVPALAYSKVRLWGGIVACMSFAVVAFLRGIGDTRTPMYVSFLILFLNLPFNYVFIFGWGWIPPMGAAGAAWGTVLAQLGGLALYLWVFWSPQLSSRYETRRWAFQPAVMWKLLTVSAPIGVQWVLETGAWTVFTAMISQWGKNELAAHHIVMQMLHLSFMPGVAISIAATTLVGQYIGARRKDLAERSGQSAIWLSGWFMGAMGVLYAVFGKQITALFNSDPHVIAIGGTLFLMAALFQIFDALSMASIGALRGAGDNQFAMWLMILASWGCFVPLIYLFGKVLGGGIVGAWWGAVAYIVLVGVVLFVRWRRGAWKSIKL